jgi:(1->4)-alpha-D-glucan 1-alpha-D-glucosylmutase
MTAPRATLRLQFHAKFAFADAMQHVSYFANLGVSHIYASPILTARKGSLHGYDVIDPTRVNPELGGEDGLRGLVEALRGAGIGLIVDIVPNHMAIGPGNAWWTDVLEYGRASRYASFFDIDWSPDDPSLQDKILLPVLGQPYGKALAAGELRLVFDEDIGRVMLRYFDTNFPLAPGTQVEIQRLTLAAFDPGTLDGRHQLHRLLERQHYRLAWWRVAGDEINWRRFFDINDLVAMRVEDDDVFAATHETILRLYREGLIDGVRVDHVDGLSQPGPYCRRLRQRLTELAAERPPSCPPGDAYLVVEKILGPGERLRNDWSVDGTTGYDFMNDVSAVLHHPHGEAPLTRLWRAISRRPTQFDAEEESARRELLERSFSSQLSSVVAALHRLARADMLTRDISRAALRRCVVELLAHFPVYRIYTSPGHSTPDDLEVLTRAMRAARRTALPADHPTLDHLERWLSGASGSLISAGLQATALARFQQLSAPIAAKAVEDTAFYRYGRLLSRTDVGFDARRFADGTEDFHMSVRARQRDFPNAMLATATHDHKRGEDVRARLAVLSEIPEDWIASVGAWLAMSSGFRRKVHDVDAPHCRDVVTLFQTLVGAWPLDLADDDAAGDRNFARRVAQWQEKALREAKLDTDWVTPNAAYEDAARDFLTAIMLEGRGRALRRQLAAFAQKIGAAGAANGLAQTLLKLTAPGVPDFYQGTEFWDLSLVDPDNRRPVDFAARIEGMRRNSLPGLTKDWRSGRIKQAVIARTLALRRATPPLFAEGHYVPIHVTGAQAGHVLAFARKLDNLVAITIVGRCLARLLPGDDSLVVPATAWQDTRIELPNGVLTGPMRDHLTGAIPPLEDNGFAVASLLSALPVALLTTEESAAQ